MNIDITLAGRCFSMKTGTTEQSIAQIKLPKIHATGEMLFFYRRLEMPPC